MGWLKVDEGELSFTLSKFMAINLTLSLSLNPWPKISLSLSLSLSKSVAVCGSDLGFCSSIWYLSFEFDFLESIRKSGLSFVFGGQKFGFEFCLCVIVECLWVLSLCNCWKYGLSFAFGAKIMFVWLWACLCVWKIWVILWVWLLRNCKKKNLDFFNYLGNQTC